MLLFAERPLGRKQKWLANILGLQRRAQVWMVLFLGGRVYVCVLSSCELDSGSLAPKQGKRKQAHRKQFNSLTGQLTIICSDTSQFISLPPPCSGFCLFIRVRRLRLWNTQRGVRKKLDTKDRAAAAAPEVRTRITPTHVLCSSCLP